MTIRLSAVLLLPAVVLGLHGCAASFPDWDEASLGALSESGRTPQQVLDDAVTVRGGNVYELFTDISVSYDGEWPPFIDVMQPELVDKGYRKASQERLLVAPRIVAQVHAGPKGIKRVVRTPDSLAVFVNDAPEDDPVRLDAAALVADCYEMFLTGPSYFADRGGTLRLLPPAQEKSRAYDRLMIELRPGTGLSEMDRYVLWIDQETGLLFRVHFTVEGMESTQGAHVDVTFDDYVERAGVLWPTHFVERVRAPVTIKAHEWRLTGLDVERGYAAGDLDDAAFRGAAAAPATPIDGP